MKKTITVRCQCGHNESVLYDDRAPFARATAQNEALTRSCQRCMAGIPIPAKTTPKTETRPAPAPRRDGPEYIVCRVCGERGYHGQAPFTNLPAYMRRCDGCC